MRFLINEAFANPKAMEINMIKNIFASPGQFEACGMFTLPHIIATFICVMLIVTVVCVVKHYNINVNKKTTFILSVVLTVLELIKIAHSFCNGLTNPDSWVPLSFCSLFMYSSWIRTFGKGFVKECADTFTVYGCVVGGTAFLIFPATSLMSYPVWHYLSLHSLIYHSLMVIFGLIALLDKKRFEKRDMIAFCTFVYTFSAVSIVLNSIIGSNFMALRQPYNIPIVFLQNLYKNVPWAYTLLVLFAFMLIPPVIATISGKMKKAKT